MMESYSHLWQVMIKYKSPSIIRKVESIHERRDNGVHLLCASLVGKATNLGIYLLTMSDQYSNFMYSIVNIFLGKACCIL